MKHIAFLVSKDPDGIFEVTPEMLEEAPEFDSLKEAIEYCNLINPDYLWLVAPSNTQPTKTNDNE